MKMTALVRVHDTEDVHTLFLDCPATQRDVDLAIQNALLKRLLDDQQLEAGATTDDVVERGYDINEVKVGHWTKGRAAGVWESLPFDEESPKIVVDLNIFDDEGSVVDGATSELTREQISDVVDHAAQLILIRRAAKRSSGDMECVLDELEEALVVAGVIGQIEAAPTNAP